MHSLLKAMETATLNCQYTYNSLVFIILDICWLIYLNLYLDAIEKLYILKRSVLFVILIFHYDPEYLRTDLRFYNILLRSTGPEYALVLFYQPHTPI